MTRLRSGRSGFQIPAAAVAARGTSLLQNVQNSSADTRPPVQQVQEFFHGGDATFMMSILKIGLAAPFG